MTPSLCAYRSRCSRSHAINLFPHPACIGPVGHEPKGTAEGRVDIRLFPQMDTWRGKRSTLSGMGSVGTFFDCVYGSACWEFGSDGQGKKNHK